MTTEDKAFDTVSLEEVEGYMVGVRRNGSGPDKKTVVLIHGIGVSGVYFIPLARELAKRYTVIALDLPGYGKAPKPSEPLTIEQLASVTYTYLQKHDIFNPIMIGHSMGCQIIAHLTKETPAYIDKMILLAPTVNCKERSVLKQSLRLVQDTFFEGPAVGTVIFSDYARMGLSRYLQTSRWMVDDHIDETLAGNSISTLIVRGTNDYIVPHEWAAHLRAVSTYHALAEITDAPHALHYKYAKETAIVCQDFIEN